MGKLDGKVAIVTGSGRGIGAEVAAKLAAAMEQLIPLGRAGAAGPARRPARPGPCT